MGTVIGSGLKAFLHRQAREQAMNVLAEAREMAQKIANEAAAQAARETQEITAKAEASLGGKSQRALTQAHHSARLTLVRRQGQVAEQVWGLARERIRALSADARRNSLRALIVDAIRQLGAADLVIVCAAADRALLAELIESEGDDLRARLTLAEESAEIMGGVRVMCVDSNRLVDNSWDERLRLMQRTRRDEVFAELS